MLKNEKRQSRSPKFLAMLLASTMTLSSLSTLALATSLEDAEDWTHNGGSIEAVDGNNMLSITAGESSTSNRIAVDAPLADGVTLRFKFYSDDTLTLKAGFKLYEGGTSSTNESARFKLDNGTLKQATGDTTLKEDFSFDSTKYSSHGSVKNGAWQEFTFHYYLADDVMCTDIFLDGVQVNEEPLTNPKTMENLDAISFITDSNCTGTFLVDEIEVITGIETPEVPDIPEVEAASPDSLTEKPVIENIPALQAPMAYPETNIYGAGLDGYELVAPTTYTKLIDVTLNGVTPDDGKDDTEKVRQLMEDANPGDALYFPNGTYDFITNDSVILTLKSGVSIIGESEEGTIFKATVSDPSVSTTFMAGMAVTDMAIRNITFTAAFWGEYPDPVSKDALGVNVDNKGNYVYGINLNYNAATGEASKQLEFTNLTFENFSKMAMRLANTQDVRVKGCTFQYATDIGGGGAGYGVSIQGTASTDTYGFAYDSMHNIVEECSFIGPYIRHGVLLQYYSHNNLIINNMLYSTGYGSIDLHGEDEYLNEIAYNEVYNCRWGGGIEIGNSGAGHDLAGPLNYVHNNYLEDGLRGIDVVLMTDDTIIENNEIKNMTYSGIMLKNAGRTLVTGNTLTNNASAFKLEADNGYTYFGVDDWAGGVPTENNIFSNTLTDNTKDYDITAGEDNIIEGYTTDEFTTDISANPYLLTIDVQNASFTRPFVPETENYYLYTDQDTLDFDLYTSAPEVTSIVVKDDVFTGSVDLATGLNEIDIVVTAQDGTTRKTYTIFATKLAEGEAVPDPVLSVSLNGTAPSIPAGRTYKLDINVMPETATNRDVTWAITSGSNVISLDSGTITTLEVGTATIKVSSVQNPEVYTEFEVVVLDRLPNQPDLDPNAVELSLVGATASTSDVGKGPELVIDGDMNTVWAGLAGSADGAVTVPATLTVELAELTHVTHVDISWFKGDQRNGVFKLYASVDGEEFVEVYEGQSSGMTTLSESYLVNGAEGMEAKYIMFEGLGNIANDSLSFWNSFGELQVFGLTDGSTTPEEEDDTDDATDDNTDDSTEETTHSFTDVKDSDWFAPYVAYAVEEGIMSGVSTTEFAPNTNTSRAMIATIMAKIAGEDTSASVNTFTDVPDGQWYTQGIAWCGENGIISGYSADTFGTNDDITREQLVTILYGFAGYLDADRTITSVTALDSFDDADAVSDYAKTAMTWAVERGFVAGSDNKINPKDSASRAQVATILNSFLEA